jgi:SAM-dependent methyltransferase
VTTPGARAAARTDTRCRVCDNASGNSRFRAREMMFGTRVEFDYVECAACGSLQIASIPDDLGAYYPDSYYSLARQNGADAGLRARLATMRLGHALGDRSLVGRLLAGWRACPPEVAALARLGVPRDARILDVGCGRGHLLRKLAAVGFSRLTGVDAFIPDDIRYPDRVSVVKAPLEAIHGTYDVVMLHHSLEHMADPHAAMAAVRRLLGSNGVAIVRVPLADSHAWRTYRADWVQLDAPRHLFVPTRRSMCIIAERARLAIADVVYDSTAFQFWGSERYRQNVPLHSVTTPQRQAARYERAARKLNEQQQGDQACFYLRAALADA